MKINFNYQKKQINYVSGYIFKGKNYRCSYIRYKTLYENYASGTENVELYFFQPKKEAIASTLVLHGLGSRNIKFLLWLGPHLANAGVNTSILILPGNYTRVENNSVSGKSYLYPDMDKMYQFWEHGVVDTLTTIDLLEQSNVWKANNILLGYCLGGMLSTIVGTIDSRINHLLFMTTGGHLPRILHESPATNFVRKMFQKGFKADYYLDDREKLYDIYDKEFSLVKNMSLEEIITNEQIHPLFKIDPISYAHLLDMKKVTFIDAYFDHTLPIPSRKILYNEMYGSNRKVLPISHVNWLPFAYFLAKYMLHKLNVNDKEIKRALLTREVIENPLEK
ncbi:alpha/beta hydrolase [Tepidimicrobium xylanilyticum]|uniref:alpha/beta hydrolase n=1 Tax=Tepidimicrobium xylanilyticum TaxID=1123352 RepID=UPI00264CB501|nr:alpha/beta hydrolase [Tepidimicrobium xylanilyticum]GMG95892.1 alpha/beta hydrolase [Tepidimicrobium xylanilyticum]